MVNSALLILTKRLTEKQKEEIVKSFKTGTAIDILSEKYNCTNSTIIRNLKNILGDLKFKEFVNKSKSSKGKSEINKIQTNDLLDQLLSHIPTTSRTERVLNNVHTIIERFKQLRSQYSNFDENNIETAIKSDFQPLTDCRATSQYRQRVAENLFKKFTYFVNNEFDREEISRVS